MTVEKNSESRQVVVIGGGITGLAAAHRLVELDSELRVVLLEANERLGGSLYTVSRDGFLIEYGADSFITNVPWAHDLCRRLGYEDQLLETNPTHRGAYVVRSGRLERLPEGFQMMAPRRWWPIVTTRVLSPRGKLRLAWERFVPARHDDCEESLAQFATRRLGREAFVRLVEPLVGGIYTGDADKLGAESTLPQFVQMERQAGSLTKALSRQRGADTTSSGARYSLFVAPRHGMRDLVQVISEKLPEGTIRLNSQVTNVRIRKDGRWDVTLAKSTTSLRCEGIIITTPAFQTSTILADSFPELHVELSKFEYASSVVVALGCKRDEITHPLDAFGMVIPKTENRHILAASFASVKFAHRAPKNHVLIRVFLGGALRPELANWDEKDLLQLAIDELRELIGFHGQPVLCDVQRWHRSMPQYHLGHMKRVACVESLATAQPRLELAGNTFHGVGVPHCVHSGEQAADRLVAEFKVG